MAAWQKGGAAIDADERGDTSAGLRWGDGLGKWSDIWRFANVRLRQRHFSPVLSCLRLLAILARCFCSFGGLASSIDAILFCACSY